MTINASLKNRAMLVRLTFSCILKRYDKFDEILNARVVQGIFIFIISMQTKSQGHIIIGKPFSDFLSQTEKSVKGYSIL